MRKLQESCVESLFQTACTTNEENVNQPNHERVLRAAAMLNSGSSRQSKKLNVESASHGERNSLNKAPLSPRNSTAVSVSASSMLDTSSSKECRRKSFVSLQFPRRNRIPKEFFEHINWQQAWQMLEKMAANPECANELIMVIYLLIITQSIKRCDIVFSVIYTNSALTWTTCLTGTKMH